LNVHRGNSCGQIRHQQSRRWIVLVDYRHSLGHRAMRVDVYRLDPRAVDDDLAAISVGVCAAGMGATRICVGPWGRRLQRTPYKSNA
jgi:hypothetical protein